MNNRALAALLCGLAVLAASPARAGETDAMDMAADTHLFKSADVFNLEFARDPQVSPDGRRIVYVRTSMDIMTDRPRGNLWIIDSDGANHRPLLSGRQGYGSPRWSPDGTRLAYISGEEGSPQLYVRWMDTGQTALITNLTQAPDGIAWSPDGRSIAFSMFVPKDTKPLAKAPAKPEGAEWAPPVKVIDTVVYRHDGEGYLESGFSHLFVVSAEGGTPRQLTDGDFDDGGQLSWTPDGSHILFAGNRNADWEYDPVESEIYSVAVADGTITQLTHRKGPDENPVVSPDGRRVAYAGFDDRLQGYQVRHLYVMDIDGSNPRLVTADLDRDVELPQWAGDSNRVYFLYDDMGVRKLGMTTLDGRVTPLVEQHTGGTALGRPYTGGSFSIAKNGTYALTLSTPYRPAELASGRGRGKVRTLTDLNGDLLGNRTLGHVEPVSWRSSFDDREIHGWIVTPPDFDPAKKYPMVLEIHGGPFASYSASFSAEIQLYAAAGYVVLYSNPRGSTGYGEEFGNLIHHAYPGNDYDDLMSGVDAVIAKGYVDANDLFVTGGSGGGVLTAWIVGRTARFRAAVVAKPVINWTSFVLTSDFNSFFYKYWFPGFPWDHQDEYWKRSPLSQAGNVTTPTMVMNGEADMRTPISEAEQFYQALKLRKVDTVMVRVPEAPHGIASRPSNLIAKADNILAWFAKYRTDKPAKDAP